MLKRYFKAGLWSLLLVFILIGCEGANEDLTPLTLPEVTAVQREGQPLRVVATTNIIGDVVSRVGGEAIELTILMAPGQDPHSYEPSSGDLATAADADVVFVNGWNLEESLIQNLENVREGGLIVPVSAGIRPLPFSEGTEETADPHVWLDPHLALVWVENIQQVLTELDPAQAEIYADQAAAYEAELQDLISLYDATLEGIPADNRIIITNHDSFGYFADAYDFNIVGTVLPGAGVLAEPSAIDLANLASMMNDLGVCNIFAESTANVNLAETVTAELENCDSVQVLSLYTGSLGPIGSGADSYISMMTYNLDLLVEGLNQ